MPGGSRPGGSSGTRTKTAANKKIITPADSQGLVYVLLENNRPKRTIVDIAGTDGEHTEIRGGISAGANVITDIDQRKAE